MPDVCKKAPLVYVVEEFLAIIASLTVLNAKESRPLKKPQKLQKVIVQKENKSTSLLFLLI